MFSNKVLGVLGLLIITINWLSTRGIYGLVSGPARHTIPSKGAHYNFIINLPSFMLISPIAHVALLQTDIYSGFRFCPNIGKKSGMQGRTCWKHAFVKSPNRANDDCLTSGIGSCIHKWSNSIIVLFWTSFSIWPFKPSARPESKSSATIMKSLSGASNASGRCVFACYEKQISDYSYCIVSYALQEDATTWFDNLITIMALQSLIMEAKCIIGVKHI